MGPPREGPTITGCNSPVSLSQRIEPRLKTQPLVRGVYNIVAKFVPSESTWEAISGEEGEVDRRRGRLETAEVEARAHILLEMV